jgi:hypothetical protein
MPKIYSHTCIQCSKPFTSCHKSQLCCDRSCGAKYRCIKKGNPPWTAAEDEILERLSGRKLFPQIVAAVQRFNKRQGQPIRSRAAVKQRLVVAKIPCRPTIDNLSCSELRRFLGVSYDRLMRWFKEYGLPRRQSAPNRFAVSFKDFRAWAALHPHKLGGIDYDSLLWILEDEELARKCSELPSPSPCPIAVKRLDTGEVFPSLGSAARSAFVSTTGIRQALKSTKEVCGIPFEVQEKTNAA